MRSTHTNTVIMDAYFWPCACIYIRDTHCVVFFFFGVFMKKYHVFLHFDFKGMSSALKAGQHLTTSPTHPAHEKCGLCRRDGTDTQTDMLQR